MNDPFPFRRGKSLAVAIMRDAAIKASIKVGLVSLDENGELHICIVQSIKRKAK